MTKSEVLQDINQFILDKAKELEYGRITIAIKIFKGKITNIEKGTERSQNINESV